MKRKKCNQYFFSVDGQTEEWYLKYLQSLINKDEELECKVHFDIKRSKPTKRAKSIVAPYETHCFHICDYESNEEIHRKNFQEIIEQLREVKSINRNLKYKMGYSNFCFELWMIIHKKQMLSPIAHRKNYVKGINEAYGKKFEYIDDYKEEKNFKDILKQIKLEDVINAVKNAEEIRKMNEEKGKKKEIYGEFMYYTENPDLTIHECIKKILIECGAIDQEK